MRSTSFGGSCLALYLLSLATALSGCASGGTAPPVLAKSDGDGGWYVSSLVSYDLPAGTVVSFEPDYGAGNCIREQKKWSHVVTTADPGVGHLTPMFTAVSNLIVESCAWERSRASWNITAVTPAGVQKTANIRLVTGSPNTQLHTVDVECHFITDLACSGGSDTKHFRDQAPEPKLRLGPIAPPPRAAELTCRAEVNARIGQPLVNLEICTIEGQPRPTLEIRAPEGVTVKRWPTENDSALVLNGTVHHRLLAMIEITASLPTGWTQTRYVELLVK